MAHRHRPDCWPDDDPSTLDVLEAHSRSLYYHIHSLAALQSLKTVLRLTDETCGGHEQPGTEFYTVTTKGGRAEFQNLAHHRCQSDVFARAKRCVQACIYSIFAFRDVSDHLSLVNGRAVAFRHFGAILVLAAAYRARHSRFDKMLSRETMMALCRQVWRLLDRLARISQVCAQERDILWGVHHVLFGCRIET